MTLYSKKEPTVMDTLIDKTNDGWRENKVINASKQTGKEQSVSMDTQSKRVYNKNKGACCDYKIWLYKQEKWVG